MKPTPWVARLSLALCSSHEALTTDVLVGGGFQFVARDSAAFRVTWEKKPPTGSFRDPRP